MMPFIVNDTISIMGFALTFFCFSYLSFTPISFAIDTLTPNQTLTDNGETLISANQIFELGFFSPWNSNKRYVGIWFKNVPQQTPIWVANKNNPISDSSGSLSITTTGNIVITTNNKTNFIWSSNSSSTTASNPILQLLYTGNFVVKSTEVSDNYLWKSFDHPCDTIIPGMKLGWDLRTGQEWYITSWKSLQDPSYGDYTYKVDPRGLPQLVLHRGLQQVTYRSGPWDGVRFGGGPIIKENAVFYPVFVFDSDNAYYSFKNMDDTIISRFVVNQTGLLQHLTWSERRNQWVDIVTLQGDYCDSYGICGPYGICNINDQPVCSCPNGFTPRLPQDWERLDWSGGCVRKTRLNCSASTGYKKVSGLKLPDTSYFLVNKTLRNPVECQEECLRNCSCVAYAKAEFSGCVVWFGDLLDIREYNEGGQDLYIRMSASDLGSNNNKSKRTIMIGGGAASIIFGIILIALISCFIFPERTAKRIEALKTHQTHDNPSQVNNQCIVEEELELPLFDLASISHATNNYSLTNKIGEGGFGPVYKGMLLSGQEIAVKRLSKDSGQGLREFKNEVILISKLQHRNLVRLLGCCIHGEERMLIYEYMPNKSLDFIFDQSRGTTLNWGNRLDIIVGIGRGVLYLHRDSRLRIIHRDLKASNILLDGKMNPKISDFGLARTFGGDQFEENTKRVMGTYGYMSPEYAIDGLFSVKSDVFSFGVLVLEIVSSKKNRGFYHPDHDLNLLGHAWKLWNEGNPMKLVYPSMERPVPESEVLRCIQVGLLCVQQRPEDRPTMPSVLLMLDSDNPLLPRPNQPGFYTERFPVASDSTSNVKNSCVSNEVTITLLHGR